MINREFINNQNINESNSLVDLIQHMDPDDENEFNTIEHSLYYDNVGFRDVVERTKGTLSILNLNCGGLSAKFDKLKLFLTNCNDSLHPVSVITLQETHFDIDTELQYFDIPGYTMINDIARINSFGGLTVYLHNSFSYKRLFSDNFHQTSPVYESLLIEIHNNHRCRKYIIGNIYRRPSELVEHLNTFITDFTECLNNIHAMSKQAYIAGDFNIDLLKISNHNYYNMFYENITSQGFFPKISRPTRLNQESHSLIDNILTNNLCTPHTSGIITSPISDHLLNFCILEAKSTYIANKTKFVEVETINSTTMENFRKSVDNAHILTKLNTDPNADPNANYNVLSNILAESKCKHIPKKVRKFNKRKHKKEKWMTDKLLMLVNKKNDLYRDWKSTTNIDEFNAKKVNFKTFDKIVDNQIEETKHKFYHDTFTSQKGDMKKTWSTINTTLNRNKYNNEISKEFLVNDEIITNPQDISNMFNSFFANIGTNLSSNIEANINNNSLSFSDYYSNPTDLCFNFNLISENDILVIIKKLKNKNSSGKDEISNRLLKSIKHEISKPLCVIINQSLSSGIFPEALKIAKVKPLFKKGDKKCLNNYRPISLLPTISKVFERVIYIQIYNYFNSHNLLCEQQYGFRSQHSTELATIKLVDNIIDQLDNRYTIKTPVAIFIDLSKAFDTLNFDILLHKLKHYGITGISLSLIENYLTNRYQYVSYENCDSVLLELKTGIPQGSILGPLFFSIYINDLVNTSDIFSYLMYADDTTLYFNVEDFNETNKVMAINNELEKVNIWLKLNKLTLNTEKTKCMFFHKRRKVNHMQFTINNKHIDIVLQFSFLGVLLDENLSWKNHIDMVTNKLSKLIGILHKLKYIYPQNALLTIYNTLFVPHINFGSLVWGTNQKRIGKIQKKAIRIITRSNYNAHTEPLLKDLGLLKTEDMFSLKILKFLHNLAHGTLPPYFEKYRPHLEKLITPYSLRPHPLPLPSITHVYAESTLVYQLVQMKNNIALNNKLILKKLDDRSHSYTGFSKYVTNSMLDKYKYECVKLQCYTCGRL